MKKAGFVLLSLLFLVYASFGQVKQYTDTIFQKGEVKSMLKVGSNVFTYGHVGGLFMSADKGVNWSYRSASMDTATNGINDLVYFNNKFYALLQDFSGNKNIVTSSDLGQTWQAVGSMTGLPTNYSIFGIGKVNTRAF